MFLPKTLTEVSSVDANAGCDYPAHKRDDVRRFLERAWRWAESDKLVEPAPGPNGHNGWKYLTDEGSAVARGQPITNPRGERPVQDEWITAAEASRLLKGAFNSETMARMTICKRAHNGLVRARAVRFISGESIHDNYEVPSAFWWAEGAEALEQNWITGDFETWLKQQLHLRAFGVSFLRADIETLLPVNVVESVELTKEPATGNTVFIGHGGSLIWLQLKDFLKDVWRLDVDEFNSVSAAGIPTVTRLEEMLHAAKFAFLIMTAEDEQHDGTHNPRLNVVHEAGLFQGKLGFRKAIILLEEKCQEFSNIRGLTHIPFPKGNIKAAFEDIRQVLAREGVISSP
jgi:predicted nucleotide-binding protein